MPRHNRRSRGRRHRQAEPERDITQALAGWRRTEVRRGASWNVQPVASDRALKDYICPGCGSAIVVATPHLVVWRADGVLGDRADLEARRHWHTHCWRIA